MRTTAALVACALLVAACTPATDHDAPPGRAAATETPLEPPVRSERAPRIPRRAKVTLGEMGGRGGDLRRAISDLKAVGVWHRLTDHLYGISIHVRPGESRVPEDRHLADARFWRAPIARGTYRYPVGAFCWIRFFPAAIEDDRQRWVAYYSQGLTLAPPPTERQFWASILGHELAHCPAHGADTAPESAALRWERKIVELLASAGIE